MSKHSDQVLDFFSQYPQFKYQRGEVILAAAETTPNFYYLESGTVKMVCISRTGTNLTLHIFFPKAIFSLLTLINENANQYDFVALQPVTVRKVPQRVFLTWLKSHPDSMLELQLNLLRGLQGLLNRIEQSTQAPAYQQVASLLVYFSKHFSESTTHHSSHKLTLTITHQEIAEWLGLSRENVSLQMKKLEREGLINIHERLIEIIDVKKLNNL